MVLPDFKHVRPHAAFGLPMSSIIADMDPTNTGNQGYTIIRMICFSCVLTFYAAFQVEIFLLQHMENFKSSTHYSHLRYVNSGSHWAKLNSRLLICEFLLQMCEVGNLSIHMSLSNLRTEGELLIFFYKSFFFLRNRPTKVIFPSDCLFFSFVETSGFRVRRFPTPTKNPFTWLFFFVSCPNYTYEVKLTSTMLYDITQSNMYRKFL